jgi:hypothetical protein
MVNAQILCNVTTYLENSTRLASDAVQVSVRSIVDCWNRNEYRMPSLQRNPDTWDAEQTSKFIMSVLESRAIHNVITTNNVVAKNFDDNDYFEILDGGHRTLTLAQFIDNKVSVIGETPWGHVDFKFNDMPPSYRSQFLQKKLTLATYTDLSEQDKAKIFEELNSGKEVSPGEFINSKIGLEDHRFIRLLVEFFAEDPTREALFDKVTRTDTSELGHLPILHLMYHNLFFGTDASKHETQTSCKRGAIIDLLSYLTIQSRRIHENKWPQIERQMRKNLECFAFLLDSPKGNTLRKYDLMSINLLLCEAPDTSLDDLVRFCKAVRETPELELKWSLKDSEGKNTISGQNTCDLKHIRPRVEIAKNWLAENPGPNT